MMMALDNTLVSATKSESSLDSKTMKAHGQKAESKAVGAHTLTTTLLQSHHASSVSPHFFTVTTVSI